jgi:hypothetical protein
MRYRAEVGPNLDYSFGLGTSNFLVNSPAAVGQAIRTRLLLFVGEYSLDTTVGMAWDTQVFGFNTASLYDDLIKDQIAGTEGFDSFVSYSSSLNTVTRVLTVDAVVNTIYSGQPVAVSVPLPVTGYGVGPYNSNPYGV